MMMRLNNSAFAEDNLRLGLRLEIQDGTFLVPALPLVFSDAPPPTQPTSPEDPEQQPQQQQQNPQELEQRRSQQTHQRRRRTGEMLNSQVLQQRAPTTVTNGIETPPSFPLGHQNPQRRQLLQRQQQKPSQPHHHSSALPPTFKLLTSTFDKKILLKKIISRFDTKIRTTAKEILLAILSTSSSEAENFDVSVNEEHQFLQNNQSIGTATRILNSLLSVPNKMVRGELLILTTLKKFHPTVFNKVALLNPPKIQALRQGFFQEKKTAMEAESAKKTTKQDMKKMMTSTNLGPSTRPLMSSLTKKQLLRLRRLI